MTGSSANGAASGGDVTSAPGAGGWTRRAGSRQAAVALSVAGLGALLLTGLGPARASVEARLEDGVAAALAAEGVRAPFDVVGRDVHLLGLSSGAAQARAVEAIRGVDGVRVVRQRPSGVQASRSATPGETPVLDQSDATRRAPTLVVRVDAEGLRIGGEVGADTTAEILRTAAAIAAGGGEVASDLVVREDVAPFAEGRALQLALAVTVLVRERVPASAAVVQVEGDHVAVEATMRDTAGFVTLVRTLAGFRVDVSDVRIDGGSTGELRPVVLFYEVGSASPVPASRPALDELDDQVRGAAEGSTVRITGHTDRSGSPEDNRRLAADRAARIADRIRALRPDLRLVVDIDVDPSGPAQGQRRVVVVVG